jgi:hypothetical protein
LAYYDTTWYVSSVKYAAVTARPQNAAVAAGALVRQFTTPSLNAERCYVCIVAGTTANTTDATWVLGRGNKVTDGTVTWIEVTGQPAVNGDQSNTLNWTQAKAVNPGPSIGVILKRNNGASYQICTTSGVMGASEPAFSDTAGATTVDNGATWTSLGPVGNFPAWGAPHARLANAYATNWGAAGNRFYLADNHTETQTTAISLNSPATLAAPTYVVCIDRTVVLPPVEANYNTGASISTTGAVGISFSTSQSNSNHYYQGITFNLGDGSSSVAQLSFAVAAYVICKNCLFNMRNTHINSIPVLGSGVGSNPNQVLWDNCQVQFSATGQSISVRNVNFEWRNTPSAIQGTMPTTLFTTQPSGMPVMVCRGVDFSAFSGLLLNNNTPTITPFVFEDCKFHASMTRYGTSTGGYWSQPVVTVRCDSGATNYKATRDEYSGAQTTETSITRVGGATDGTTPTSDKIVTNAQATFLTPYRMLPLAIWNDTTGADVTVTVYGTVNAGSLPLNDEIWMDVQYLGSSGSPQASFKSTCKSHPLAAGAAVAADSSTWNNTTISAVTWEAASVTAVTLSGGNLVATNTGTTSTDQGAKVASADAKNSGKYYFEATWTARTAGANYGIGIGTYVSTYIGMGNTGGVTGVNAYFLGTVWSNGGNVWAMGGAWAAGQVMGIAVDLDNRKIWFRLTPSSNWNDNATHNPATNTGGIAIPAGAMVPFVTFGGSSGAANNVVTANFGASAFVGAVPSGFTSGWSSSSVYTPFKLVATLTSPQPQMKGYVYVSVRAAKPSTTYYIDPLPTLS